jgi:acetyltransferase
MSPISAEYPPIPLPGGCLATLRPVVPGDAAAEREFVAGLSTTARVFRFHGAVNGLTDAMVENMTRVDQQHHVALVATVVQHGRETVIADARYVVDGDAAEFAIAVADRWQGCGIARRLLEALAACARRSGLRWLVGEVLATNQAMLGLAQRLGFLRSARGTQSGVVRIERAVAAPVAEEGIFARIARRCRRWLGARSDPGEMFVPF